MNKKINMLFILMLSIIVLTGCNKNEPKKEEEENLTFFEWANKNLETGDKPRKINCPEMNENSFMIGSDKIFVTDNTIYKYNTKQLFSNDKNCKEVGSIDNPIAVSRDNAINEKGILYNDFWQKVKDANYDGNFEKDNYHDGWKEYLKRFNINKKILSASDIHSYSMDKYIPHYEIITYTNDGLYLYYIDYTNYSSNECPKGKEFKYKVNIDSLKDEEIIKVYGSIIKTDKAFYTLSSNVINKEECEKYADVKCEYSYYLIKDDILTKYYDEIMNITNEYFITKNYELISVPGYFYLP
jgi:hypothetical protein